MDTSKDWQQCNSETFWSEVATCSHVVQLYEHDETLLNLLEDFIVGGISVDDSVFIIATKEHLSELEQRLVLHDLDIDALRASNQYHPLDAEEVLSKFMLNSWPDYWLFVETVTELFDLVRNSKRAVRVFGEMVALLWAQGNSAAAVELEHLWNSFFEKEPFSLFCAYPKNKFLGDANNTLSHICKAHSIMITNAGISRFNLSYQHVK